MLEQRVFKVWRTLSEASKAPAPDTVAHDATSPRTDEFEVLKAGITSGVIYGD